MSDDKHTAEAWHKREAVNNFNGTWDLMDKENRTKEEQLEMIHKAHASRFHWSFVGDDLNLARGEWQVSRVYAICEMGESALYHGNASLDYCKHGGIGDFDLVFAYEAIARAYMVLKDKDQMTAYLEMARTALSGIEKQEDLAYAASELDSIQL